MPRFVKSVVGLANSAHTLFVREPGIDNLPRRRPRKLSPGASIWEAITAHSHHPDYPAEIEVKPEREKDA